jgi:3-hydroxy-3-methylglutaryl CoA synthase
MPYKANAVQSIAEQRSLNDSAQPTNPELDKCKKKGEQSSPKTQKRFKLKVYIEKCPTTTERVFAKSDFSSSFLDTSIQHSSLHRGPPQRP